MNPREPKRRWALVTGEYPPAAGGVADYTGQLAAALAAAGDEVHVWAPAPARAVGREEVHILPDAFGGRSRARIDADWAQLGPGLQCLVQYVPHAFGQRGMNFGFSHWLSRRRDLGYWVMFHEVVYPREAGQPLRHRLLAAVTWRMARQIYASAARAFVAIPAWGELLQEIAPGGSAPEWLPVPSNLPASVPEPERQAARQRAGAGANSTVVGWFGGRLNAYSEEWMARTVAAVLRDRPQRIALLSGSAGPPLRKVILAGSADLEHRVFAPGHRDAAETAAQLAAADLMVEAYPDGISARRGTAMAALRLGCPLLATVGRLSEPLWRDSPAVALVDAATPERLVDEAEALLQDGERRRALGRAGQQLYREQFALEHVVARLRGQDSRSAVELA